MIRSKVIFSFVLFSILAPAIFISCSENKPKEAGEHKETRPGPVKYDGVTIELEISNKNCLSILLADDGTINRKGDSSFNPKENKFIIGITKNSIFDSLMNEMPDDILPYCNAHYPDCDTLKQTSKAKIAFGNNNNSCEIAYCVNGTIDDLPVPIRFFIKKAVQLTEPWYQEQLKMIKTK